MNLLETSIRPMLAGRAEPFDSGEHLFELKWDGIRCIAYIDHGKLRLQNRNLRLITQSYPELAVLPKSVKCRTAILDGEIVVLDEGIPNFGKLQNRFQVDESLRVDIMRKLYPVTYVAFDLLFINGKNLVESRLEQRKEHLKEIIEENPHLLYGDYVDDQGKPFFKEAVKKGFEGTMAKERGSAYLIGERSNSWLKIKGKSTIDAIIAGYTEGTGKREDTFGALVLASYSQEGELMHLGNVGTGFSAKEEKTLRKMLDSMRVNKRSIEGEVKAPAPITWVVPKTVCEVEYASFTEDGKLRLPRYVHLREDVPPEDCVLDSR